MWVGWTSAWPRCSPWGSSASSPIRSSSEPPRWSCAGGRSSGMPELAWPSATAPVVELRGVFKEFSGRSGRLVALEGIDLAIAPSEFAAVLGPSGCGKSTLLNMVAGFDGPTRGEVCFNGLPVTAPDPRRGVVFQEPALFPWYTVLDNVVFGLKTRGVPADERRSRAATVLDQVGLRGF